MNEELKKKWGNTLPQKGDLYYRYGQITELIHLPTYASFYEYFSQHFLSPIPLTPEVMERIEEAEYDIDQGYFRIDLPTGQEIGVCFFADGPLMQVEFEEAYLWYTKLESPSPSLHWLQQQCRLLGKELTINNWES